jgi:NADH dehydrogenase
MKVPQRRLRVVIIGAGFGGLWTARALADAPVEVLVIDRNNYHTFNPMLYQVATAELAPEQIVYPVRKILRKLPNAKFIMAEVTQIDFEHKLIETNSSRIPYDYLVLATGSVTQLLDTPGVVEYAYRLDNIEQAIALRNQIINCFELAAQEQNPEKRRQLLTFAIVGGGPTGVELAGALVELIRDVLPKDYPTLNIRETRVCLIHSTNNLLSGMMPHKLQVYTLKQLRKMGVEVYLEVKATEVTPESVYLVDGKIIPTRTVIWAVGVQADPQVERWGLPTSTKSRVTVLPTLQLSKYQEVYAVGDIAFIETDSDSIPMVAPAAIQQGTATGKNIKRHIIGRYPIPFRYRDKGSIAIIARQRAAGRVGKFCFTGFLAWSTWLGVHLYYLPGFCNRLLVLIIWLQYYFFHKRSVGLILHTEISSSKRAIIR